MDETEKGVLYRKRYWLRSYLGYPSVRDSLPNPTHYGLAALQHTGIVPHLTTQVSQTLAPYLIRLSHFQLERRWSSS